MSFIILIHIDYKTRLAAAVHISNRIQELISCLQTVVLIVGQVSCSPQTITVYTLKTSHFLSKTA